MAYVYQVSFDIPPERQGELEVGSSLERVLGLLAGLPPFGAGVHDRLAPSTRSICPNGFEIVVQSVWDHWEDLVTHRQSPLAEDKILREFAYLSPEALEIHDLPRGRLTCRVDRPGAAASDRSLPGCRQALWPRW